MVHLCEMMITLSAMEIVKGDYTHINLQSTFNINLTFIYFNIKI